MTDRAHHIEEGEYAVKGVSHDYDALIRSEGYFTDSLWVMSLYDPNRVIESSLALKTHLLELHV